MKGTVKTFLPEKKYGFIQGDDGKDYFFHANDFKNQNDTSKICDGAYLSFNQTASPKGYQAKNITFVNDMVNIKYALPERFLVSKNGEIKGWDIVEYGDWIVLGNSRNSPDEAKENAIENAEYLGSNGMVDFRYFKTTGDEAGPSGGTHYFTVHNYSGRIVTLAKKSVLGEYSIPELMGLNEYAMSKKEELVELNNKSKNKRNMIYSLAFFASIVSFSFAWWLPILWFFIAWYISDVKEYDWWLEHV